MAAIYDLNKVKAHAKQALDDPTIESVWFSAPKKSIFSVIDEFQLKGQSMDPLRAKIYILDSIIGLQDSDYYATHTQWGTIFADWYGIVRDQIPWYVKFFLDKDTVTDREFLDQVSFHRTDRDIKLANGLLIKTDGSIQ